MSRVAKKPIPIPSNVDVIIDGQDFKVKGPEGKACYRIPNFFSVIYENNVLSIRPIEGHSYLKRGVSLDALAGTIRSNLNNLIIGVNEGYEKKLNLVGVGFRGQNQDGVLRLNLGFSYPIIFKIPEGVIIEMPIPTEIIIKGIDKQLVGQVAAKIRAIRSVEPYKGKGIRYSKERVILKETKKK